MVIHIVRSITNPTAWKAWVSGAPDGNGYIRQGFAWRTRKGAVNAAKKRYPQCTAYSVEE